MHEMCAFMTTTWR